MTFSYDPSISRDLDRVRLLVGDTDGTNPQLQDEELLWLLTDEPAYLDAAITAAEAIAAKYARQVDIAAGPVRQSLMQLQTSYEKLADRLRRKLARRGIAPFAGGISQSARDAALCDTDLIQPVFSQDMETEPGTEPDDVSPFVPPFPFS